MLADPLFLDKNSKGTANILAIIGGADPTPIRLRRGMYEISHFSFDHCLPYAIWSLDEIREKCGWWLERCDLGDVKFERDDIRICEFGSYGVCDSPEQFLGHDLGKWIEVSEKYYVVSFTKISKASQPAQYGWRWHKWGSYIGVHEPQYEYLYDEGDEIQEVYCYQVYECISENAIMPIEEGFDG